MADQLYDEVSYHFVTRARQHFFNTCFSWLQFGNYIGPDLEEDEDGEDDDEDDDDDDEWNDRDAAQEGEAQEEGLSRLDPDSGAMIISGTLNAAFWVSDKRLQMTMLGQLSCMKIKTIILRRKKVRMPYSFYASFISFSPPLSHQILAELSEREKRGGGGVGGPGGIKIKKPTGGLPRGNGQCSFP
jgi:hypothetical protein